MTTNKLELITTIDCELEYMDCDLFNHRFNNDESLTVWFRNREQGECSSVTLVKDCGTRPYLGPYFRATTKMLQNLA